MANNYYIINQLENNVNLEEEIGSSNFESNQIKHIGGIRDRALGNAILYELTDCSLKDWNSL